MLFILYRFPNKVTIQVMLIFQWLKQVSRGNWWENWNVRLFHDNIFSQYCQRILSWLAVNSCDDGAHAGKFWNISEILTKINQFSLKYTNDKIPLKATFLFSGSYCIDVDHRQISNSFDRKRICRLWKSRSDCRGGFKFNTNSCSFRRTEKRSWKIREKSKTIHLRS